MNRDRPFVLCHADYFYTSDVLGPFFAALKELVREDVVTPAQFKCYFVKTSPGQSEVKQLGLAEITVCEQVEVARVEMSECLERASCILFVDRVEGQKQPTERFYRLLSLGKPILALVANSECYESVGLYAKEVCVANLRDQDAIRMALAEIYRDWRRKRSASKGKQRSEAPVAAVL